MKKIIPVIAMLQCTSGCTFAPRVAEVLPTEIHNYNYSTLNCEELFNEVKRIRATTVKAETYVKSSWSIVSKDSNSEEVKMLADLRGRAKSVQSSIRKNGC